MSFAACSEKIAIQVKTEATCMKDAHEHADSVSVATNRHKTTFKWNEYSSMLLFKAFEFTQREWQAPLKLTSFFLFITFIVLRMINFLCKIYAFVDMLDNYYTHNKKFSNQTIYFNNISHIYFNTISMLLLF